MGYYKVEIIKKHVYYIEAPDVDGAIDIACETDDCDEQAQIGWCVDPADEITCEELEK